MLDLLLWPLTLLYGAAVCIRNKLFDWKILASREFDIPIVCVGNLTVGGTGKTPMTEMLIEHLAGYYNVAMLSLGYKRRTKGFMEVLSTTPFRACGDEPKQIKLKFPDIPVFVCKDRGQGIDRIRELYPKVNLIILDDAFQHRQVEPWVNIVMMDYSRPVYRDRMLPLGTLRDTPSQLRRAHFVVVNKCPDDINPLDMRLVQKSLGLFAFQSLYFSRMQNGPAMPLFPDLACGPLSEGSPVILMAGVGSPGTLMENVGGKYNVVESLIFPDHHPYRVRDLEKMSRALEAAPQGTVIVTTEKDAVKLTNRRTIPEHIQQNLYFIPVQVEFIDGTDREFMRKIYHYVRSNQKHGLIHS